MAPSNPIMFMLDVKADNFVLHLAVLTLPGAGYKPQEESSGKGGIDNAEQA